MQMILYGEYGIKTSISAIKWRLQDAKSERKGKKRTGKTKKDRQKARNAKYAQPVDTSIKLPASDVIQIRELAELMDVGSGEVIKYLMMNEGEFSVISTF